MNGPRTRSGGPISARSVKKKTVSVSGRNRYSNTAQDARGVIKKALLPQGLSLGTANALTHHENYRSWSSSAPTACCLALWRRGNSRKRYSQGANSGSKSLTPRSLHRQEKRRMSLFSPARFRNSGNVEVHRCDDEQRGSMTPPLENQKAMKQRIFTGPFSVGPMQDRNEDLLKPESVDRIVVLAGSETIRTVVRCEHSIGFNCPRGSRLEP